MISYIKYNVQQDYIKYELDLFRVHVFIKAKMNHLM